MSSPFDVLDQKYPDIRFELYPTEKAKRVYLTGFIVPYTMRGQGVGSAFMNDLTKIADDNGWKITLTPSDSYGGNVTRLKSFYKGFGFVENKGQNRDFSHREDMYRDPKGSLNEEINKMRKTMGLNEAPSKYTVDITPEEIVRRVPFLRNFKNFSDKTRLQFQHISNNENVSVYNKDGEPILFKQFNISSEFNYSIVDMYDGRHRFMLSLKHQTWLMPPELKEPEQALFYRIMTMAMTKQMESLSYSYDEVLEQETLTEEQWNQIINDLNKSFFELENYLDEVLPADLAPHLNEGEVFDEARSSDYLSWKRKNVTIRGVKEAGEENNAGAMLGRGLYTAFLSNKELARQYGKVYFVLGAMPKNPKVFNTLNEWEIWFYNTLVYKYSKEKGSEYPDKRDFTANTTIEDEMQKLGYDGIVIKGREMVNFKPEDNIKYFSNEDQLENYYETVVKQPLDEEGSLLNEKLTNIEDDVDMLYELYFRKGVEEVEQTRRINGDTFEQTDTDTSILKNELCVKAHAMNPCTIVVNKASNHYNPNKKLISIAISLQGANYVINEFGGDLDRAIEEMDPRQAVTMKKEFTEAKIKGSIHHELVHWLDDTFNNQHIKKRIDKNIKLHNAGEALPFNSVTVNAHYMEIQAQIHNIKQLYNKHSDEWDTLSFEDMIYLSPTLTNTYRSLPYSLKIEWVKKIKMRMFREGLLGKKMFN